MNDFRKGDLDLRGAVGVSFLPRLEDMQVQLRETTGGRKLDMHKSPLNSTFAPTS